MPDVCLSFLIFFTIFIIVVTQKLVLLQSKNVTAKCTEILSSPLSIRYLLANIQTIVYYMYSVLHWVVCIVHVYKSTNLYNVYLNYIYVLYVYLYSWTVLKNTNIQTIIHNCQIQVTSKNIIIIGSVTVISSNPTSMSCPIYNGTLDSFVCSSINQVTPHRCTFEYPSWANLCSPTLYCTANLQLLMIYINYLIKVSREPL